MARKHCENCFATETTSWRKHPLDSNKYVCNRCGIYYSRHGNFRKDTIDDLEDDFYMDVDENDSLKDDNSLHSKNESKMDKFDKIYNDIFPPKEIKKRKRFDEDTDQLKIKKKKGKKNKNKMRNHRIIKKYHSNENSSSFEGADTESVILSDDPTAFEKSNHQQTKKRRKSNFDPSSSSQDDQDFILENMQHSRENSPQATLDENLLQGDNLDYFESKNGISYNPSEESNIYSKRNNDFINEENLDQNFKDINFGNIETNKSDMYTVYESKINSGNILRIRSKKRKKAGLDWRSTLKSTEANIISDTMKFRENDSLDFIKTFPVFKLNSNKEKELDLGPTWTELEDSTLISEYQKIGMNFKEILEKNLCFHPNRKIIHLENRLRFLYQRDYRKYYDVWIDAYHKTSNLNTEQILQSLYIEDEQEQIIFKHKEILNRNNQEENPWTDCETQIIILGVQFYREWFQSGNSKKKDLSWQKISEMLPGRNILEIQKYFFTNIIPNSSMKLFFKNASNTNSANVLLEQYGYKNIYNDINKDSDEEEY